MHEPTARDRVLQDNQTEGWPSLDELQASSIMLPPERGERGSRERPGLQRPAEELTTQVAAAPFTKIRSLGKEPAALRARLEKLGLSHLPVDDSLVPAKDGGPLGTPFSFGRFEARNALVAQPMEGTNAHRGNEGKIDGSPTFLTIRAAILDGLGGYQTVWGREACAVTEDGRASPRQTLITPENADGIKDIFRAIRDAHQLAYGDEAAESLVVGTQLTHSGRNSRPDESGPNPQVMFHHPLYDPDNTAHILSDQELDAIREHFVRAAGLAVAAGVQFVDVKMCHGYLLHECLGAYRRQGAYGGESLAERAAYPLSIIESIKTAYPDLEVGVRLSAFDTIPEPFLDSETGAPLPSVTELGAYVYGFGINPDDPMRVNMEETIQFVKMLQEHGVVAVNVTAGNPYKTDTVQAPTPNDLWKKPTRYDPLISIYRLLEAARQVKQGVPEVSVIASGVSALEEYLPHVAQGVIREGWFDGIGAGRRVLSDPYWANRALAGGGNEWSPEIQGHVCRSLLICRAAMRATAENGALCYPLLRQFQRDMSHELTRKWLQENNPHQ
ncbi:NADH:flavin oxidoreductase [bacterium]|nr:NADH:flavin oxidoreductase [bacterium]